MTIIEQERALDELAAKVEVMISDSMRHHRRRYLGYGLALLVGGLLAGWNLAVAFALQ